ncbi:MAG: aminoacyl-tRNA hydrolase [Spirochaetales bacterium]|jgi:PTH1 family peptidyl-tRNA hydrolase|nr:aminoacyl-tRNA hydrolase [Spirochaetales bacterium]
MWEKNHFFIQLLVFLGNPGKEYEKTRHNVAWMAAEQLPFYASLAWQEKFKGRYALTGAGQPAGRLILLTPQTFMNLSGDCVRACMSFFKIEAGRLLVVHDETELPFGTISFRRGGGLGGHNGLKSIRNNLGTADFWRLRIGVGRPARGDVSSHVLGRFSPAEEPLLEVCLGKVAEILPECCADPEIGAAAYGKTRVIL